MDKQAIDSLIEKILSTEILVSAILSSPLKKTEAKKITVRPVLIQGVTHYQLTKQIVTQAHHSNLSKKECQIWLSHHLMNYKQSVIYTQSSDYQILVNKKSKITLLTKPPSKLAVVDTHNRTKHYILQEGAPIPFLVQLGVMSERGKIIPKKSDKFRQINRFLELVEDVLGQLEKRKKIFIVDFGCGKAYLTFALYHYLRCIKNLNVEILGLDLKADVIIYCQDLAQQLGYQKHLHFQLGDIHSYQTQQDIDMVIALHACDTATDAALEKAIKWNSKVILCAPCCQNELYKQVKSSPLNPLLKHGILKERFAALATDALRAQLLEVLGYQTQVVEFIDMEHTPKNLLIRAVKSGKNENSQQLYQIYLEMKKALQVSPALEKYMKKELDSLNS